MSIISNRLIDINSKPLDSECIFLTSTIAMFLKEPEVTIRTWSRYYYDYLYIKQINGRYMYTQISVMQLKTIKHLSLNKAHKDVINFIALNGFQYILDTKKEDNAELEIVVTSYDSPNYLYIDLREWEYKQYSQDKIGTMKKNLEIKQRLYQEQQSKKSFWDRLFKR